jgi:hypothetical protein
VTANICVYDVEANEAYLLEDTPQLRKLLKTASAEIGTGKSRESKLPDPEDNISWPATVGLGSLLEPCDPEPGPLISCTAVFIKVGW